MTHYHAHITVPDNAVVPKGWKKTDIFLEGEKTQHDVMLTKHYLTKVYGANEVLSDISNLGRDDILRIKIEQENDFFLPVNETTYAEIHMLCPTGVTPNGEDWVRSRNPKKEGAYFYNKRIYSAPSMEEVIAETVIEQAEVDWVELKIEQVVFDSNRERDRWWA